MTAEEIRRIQRQIMNLVAGARSDVAALQERIVSIWSNTERLTEQARRVDVSTALAEGRTRIEGVLSDEAGFVLERGFDEVERRLGDLRAVEPEELAESRAVLSPVLGAAWKEPEVLINLYRKRHGTPADRRLIEGTAAAVRDALAGSDGGQFAEQWRALEQELALSRGPEELEALSHRDTLEELAKYLDAARRLVGADLSLMDPSFTGEDRDVVAVLRATVEADVNRYEAEHRDVVAA